MAGLPASSDSVAYPDHPLLLRGPDVLASVRSSLTAYFVLDQPVSHLPIRVLSNVVLSRLALPREANFVLILGERADIRNSDSEAYLAFWRRAACGRAGVEWRRAVDIGPG